LEQRQSIFEDKVEKKIKTQEQKLQRLTEEHHILNGTFFDHLTAGTNPVNSSLEVKLKELKSLILTANLGKIIIFTCSKITKVLKV
jgi:hypothetical protein